MKAHELAQKLLEGPDLDVRTWYDGLSIPLEAEDVEVIVSKDNHPEAPFILFV